MVFAASSREIYKRFKTDNTLYITYFIVIYAPKRPGNPVQTKSLEI